MSQPTAYTRQADFTEFSAANPTTPHSGVSLDAEFNALAVTIAGVLANLLRIQRDDGALKNGIVTYDSLSTSVLALLGASSQWALKGPWATATSYAQSDVVVEGGGTYAAGSAHVSGVFADDLAAGKWILLFDSDGTTPADGSVTSAKIAPGAVLAAAIGFTALDLAGTIRAGGGLSAGTAALGEMLAAKKAAGDVIGKVDRTTRDQGAVGWKIGGGAGGVDWHLRQSPDSDVLELYDGTAVRVSWSGGLSDLAGRVRATGDSTPAGGSGISLRYSASTGYLDSYNHTAAAWLDARIRGKIVYLDASGVNVMKADSAGVNFPVEVSIGASEFAAGYRDVPQNTQSAAYTLVLSDRGKHVYSANVAAQTITVPPNSSVAFPIGAAVAIVNRGTNPITLQQGSGVTLRLAGSATTGNRTLATNAVATILKVQADEWMVTGAGVS